MQKQHLAFDSSHTRVSEYRYRRHGLKLALPCMSISLLILVGQASRLSLAPSPRVRGEGGPGLSGSGEGLLYSVTSSLDLFVSFPANTHPHSGQLGPGAPTSEYLHDGQG